MPAPHHASKHSASHHRLVLVTLIMVALSSRRAVPSRSLVSGGSLGKSRQGEGERHKGAGRNQGFSHGLHSGFLRSAGFGPARAWRQIRGDRGGGGDRR